MKQATHSEREKFVALMIRNCPAATASTCQRLMRLGATYRRFRDMQKRTIDETEKMDHIILKIARLAQSIGLQIAFGFWDSQNSVKLIGRGQLSIDIPTS